MSKKQREALKIDCRDRGFHRIPAMELHCIWCGAVLTATQVLENERNKISKMEGRDA